MSSYLNLKSKIYDKPLGRYILYFSYDTFDESISILHKYKTTDLILPVLYERLLHF